jgi:hypothetical protein
MDKKSLKAIRLFLWLHIGLFAFSLLYVFIVVVIKKYFYMYDAQMPWQETFLNKPLKFSLSLLMVLYWFKLFVAIGLVVFLKSNRKIERNILIPLIWTTIVYLLIKLNFAHNLFDFILHGYDFKTMSLNSSQYNLF